MNRWNLFISWLIIKIVHVTIACIIMLWFIMFVSFLSYITFEVCQAAWKLFN